MVPIINQCDEQFTSKTCSKCGELNQKLKGQKVFYCDNCHTILDRDVNGAINILFRYLTLSQASLSVLVQSKVPEWRRPTSWCVGFHAVHVFWHLYVDVRRKHKCFNSY